MYKNPKTMLLLFAVAPTMMALGCGGSGWWKWAHTAAYHIAELIQTAGALNLI
jgi:hypothetical protein